jgi:hypothetical protein
MSPPLRRILVAESYAPQVLDEADGIAVVPASVRAIRKA